MKCLYELHINNLNYKGDAEMTVIDLLKEIMEKNEEIYIRTIIIILLYSIILSGRLNTFEVIVKISEIPILGIFFTKPFWVVYIIFFTFLLFFQIVITSDNKKKKIKEYDSLEQLTNSNSILKKKIKSVSIMNSDILRDIEEEKFFDNFDDNTIKVQDINQSMLELNKELKVIQDTFSKNNKKIKRDIISYFEVLIYGKLIYIFFIISISTDIKYLLIVYTLIAYIMFTSLIFFYNKVIEKSQSVSVSLDFMIDEMEVIIIDQEKIIVQINREK